MLKPSKTIVLGHLLFSETLHLLFHPLQAVEVHCPIVPNQQLAFASPGVGLAMSGPPMALPSGVKLMISATYTIHKTIVSYNLQLKYIIIVHQIFCCRSLTKTQPLLGEVPHAFAQLGIRSGIGTSRLGGSRANREFFATTFILAIC